MLISLRGRIIALFVLILVMMQIACFGAVRGALFGYAEDSVAHDLVTGERVLQRALAQNAQRLEQAVSLVAADFAFREAVATRDSATVDSALRNHGRRIGADLMLLVDAAGTVVVDTSAQTEPGAQFAFPALLTNANRRGTVSMLATLRGRIYQLVAVPVLAPLPVGSVVIGFGLDERFARDFGALADVDVSFVVAPPGQPARAMVSTLAPSKRAALEAVPETGPDRESIELAGTAYRSHRFPINIAGAQRATVVLQRSLAEAYAPFDRLQTTMLGLTGLALVIAIAVSWMTARGVTGPIAQLAALAVRIGRGDPVDPIPARGTREVRALTDAFFRMRGDLAEREQRITDLAYSDALTGLANRAMFQSRLTQSLHEAAIRGAKLAVLMIDLDHFKYVNDALGHRFGDLLLREVGARLTAVLGPERGLVARLGGDEFAVLLEAGTAIGAKAIAESVRGALEAPLTLEGHVLDIGASIGIVLYPDHGTDLELLLSRVDMAMYAAKRERSGSVVYHAGLDAGAHERLGLLSELRRGIDEGQLRLHYQPKLDLATGEVLYAEALVRWMHPERGLVPPDTFIPFAEQTGLIRVLTRWVVENAVAQLAEWRARGLDIGIAINVSVRDLLDPELSSTVVQALVKHDVPAAALRLEITESAVMDDPRRALQTLHRLREVGLALSIDDFGTGYSSLAYLHKLPVDEIKIDKSFVRAMASNRDDDVIVRATIELGHNMGLKVVAEGVEDEVTMSRLRAYGCDLAQGFLLSRPTPPDEFERWLDERRNPVLAA